MKQNVQSWFLMFIITSVLTLFTAIPAGFSQDEGVEIYRKVRVMVNSPEDMLLLQENDITVDHYQGNLKEGFILVLNQNETERLMAIGLPYEVLIADLNQYYRNRRPLTQEELEKGRQIQQADNVTGFEYGSMGGFYTYDEVVTELDSMRLLYPNITEKSSLGITEQGRDIWMVKISDNPQVNESAAESAIYYDALHHAREPAAMAVTIYYMYWLLENYGVKPEATYLVDNREIFFIPVVNPDGYVYNQTTNPSGGGMWRKNRKDNPGSSCFGVDLNRNYSFGWGDPNGSSGDPCDNTYRGPTPFSEPETRAVRDLILAVSPAISFSTHSVAGRYLNPYGYTSISPDYDVYSEFASDFAVSNRYLYGRTSEMLGYFSSGTTRDYLHSEGTYAWTPEIGGSDFWPFQSEIIPLVSENLYPMKYLSWVGGAFADFQNYTILGNGYVGPADTLKLGITVKNRGLRMAAKQVMVDVATNYPHAVPLVTTVNYDSISARQIKNNFSQPVLFLITTSATFLDEIPLYVTISQEGVVSSRDTVTVTVGKITAMFSDDAENGKINWTPGGAGQPQWDTTYVGFYSEYHAFADSRYGNSANNVNSYFTLSQNIDLSQALNPRLEFWAKWAIEPPEFSLYDYVRLQVSTNNGTTWTSLSTSHTQNHSGQPNYYGIKHWVKEEIDLSAYVGQQVKFRFLMHTDGGLVLTISK
jgi:murein tripeptide amidase MpaA